MSRRPRTVHEQRVARALRTMAPGGRLRSESPVRRPRFTGGAPVVAAPLYWWKMDDASGSAVESVSNAGSIAWSYGPPTYEVAPLSAGTAITLSSSLGTYGSTPDITADLAPGPTGLIVLDFWIGGVQPYSTQVTEYLSITQSSGTVAFVVRDNGVTGELEFKADSTVVASVATWADPAHIRWEINVAGGSTVVKINGSAVATTSGATFGWSSTASWKLNVGCSGSVDTTLDEIQIFTP
jgi:hypothetical protein